MFWIFNKFLFKIFFCHFPLNLVDKKLFKKCKIFWFLKNMALNFWFIIVKGDIQNFLLHDSNHDKEASEWFSNDTKRVVWFYNEQQLWLFEEIELECGFFLHFCKPFFEFFLILNRQIFISNTIRSFFSVPNYIE